MKDQDIKEVVREKYGKIAAEKTGCGCGCSCNTEDEITDFSESYTHLDGYVGDADLNLGCGLPTEHAGIKPGHHVLDLGCGAGNDCFIARKLVGEKGYITGLDFTDEMLKKATINNIKMGYHNVDFIKGDIENIPLADFTQDVVISNCVLNLVPDKVKAFAEVFRVLKNTGHFCISDVVLVGQLPEDLQKDAAMYAGCVAGALQMDEYMGIIEKAGFVNVEIKAKKEIILPDELLLNYLDEEKIKKFRDEKTGIFSITVTGEKPR